MSVAAGAFSGGLALGLVVFLIIIIVGWRRRRKEPSDDGQSDLRVARGLGDTRSERLKNATYVSAAFLVVAS
jgi:multisubunit Na+/H+ antiporter MnhB subunit